MNSIKALLAAMAVTVILSHAVAQDEYYVRTQYAVNMREEPSRESRVAMQASPGEILQVIGAEGDWLNVNGREGNLWIAGWLDYTVIGRDGPAMFKSRVADMSCRKGPGWSYGWIMPEADCDLELRPPAGVLPPHERTVPADGPDYIIERVNRALSTLKEKAPEWYAYVTLAVDKFTGYEAGSALDIVSGQAYTHPNVRTVYLSRHAASGAGGNLIGIIVHEACHIHEYESGVRLQNFESEITCHTMELYALEAMGMPTPALESVRNTILWLLFLGR